MGRGQRGGGAGREAALPLLIGLAGMVAAAPAAAQDSAYRVGEPVQVSAARPAIVHVEPTVAASPRDPGRLVAAVIAVEDPQGEGWHDSQRVVVYASRDGGRSWEPRPLPGPSGGWMSADPWLTWTSRDVVYLALIASESIVGGEPSPVQIYRSDDGGGSWSGPTEPFPPGSFQDHPVVASAPGPDGEPWLYAFGSSGDEDDGVDVAVLEPGARRFRSLPSFLPGPRQVNLGGAGAVPGGGVAFTWFRMGARPWELSAAAGRTDHGGWTSTGLREDILPVGFPGLAVDESRGDRRGRVYAVWMEGADPLDQREPRVLLAHSDDGGRSWSEPTRVHRHAAPTRRALPAVAVNRDGAVGVAWLDWRDRPGRSDCPALYFAASTDGGSTFRREVRLDGPACFGTEANGVAARRWRSGGGDYLGMAAGADGTFHLVWPGSSTGVFQAWSVAVRLAPEPPPSRR